MKIKIGLITIVLIIALFTLAMQKTRNPELLTRLIITVEKPILESGGAVIVAGRKIPDTEWRKLPQTPPDDDGSRKIFNISVSSPASVIEFFYPESGTYSFEFVSASETSNPRLTTREIEIGSGEITDPETKQQIAWDTFSTIHVRGAIYDEGWARIFSSKFTEAFRFGSNDQVTVTRFDAGRVILLSSAAIETYVRNTK